MKEAEVNRELAWNRHHFKEIKFHSSLTNKDYYSKTREDGNLGVYDAETNEEIESHSNSSKKQILLQSVRDLGEEVPDNKTLYELQHKLQKLILDK